MFIDTHCHLFKEYYDNLEDVIKNAKENNIFAFFNNATNVNDLEDVLESLKYEEVYGAIGIHPEDALTYKEEDLKKIEDNLSNPKVIAIGEIGLDYHYEGYDREKQIELFEYQLGLAQKYDKPVIVHSRDATEDTIKVLKKYNVKGTIHSFSGSIETAREYIKMGFLLGINGVVTFKNCKLKDIINVIGLDNIVFETDSPYLTPEPYRGRKNEPKNVFYIAKFLSEYLNIDVEKLSCCTNNNLFRLYNRHF